VLKAGLGPFIERELKSAFQDQAVAQAVVLVGDDGLLAGRPLLDWDTAAVLRLMWEAWKSGL
jgi:hypothetical protein